MATFTAFITVDVLVVVEVPDTELKNAIGSQSYRDSAQKALEQITSVEKGIAIDTKWVDSKVCCVFGIKTADGTPVEMRGNDLFIDGTSFDEVERVDLETDYDNESIGWDFDSTEDSDD